MAAHRIPLQNFRSNFDRKDPESRQDTSKKKLAALIDIQLSISRRDDIFYQPQSSLISARLPRRSKAAVIPIAID
jgi:hypothetical protein